MDLIAQKKLIIYYNSILFIAAGWNKGKQLSVEHRRRISQGLRGRAAWNRGKKLGPHSEEAKQKMRMAKIGTKHSLKTRAKLSQINLGRPVRYWLGKQRSEDTRRKIRESLLGRFGGKECYWYARKKSAETVEKIRVKRLSQIFPKKDSSIELKLQNALSDAGITFEKHRPIIGQPDLFIAPNICIFCDGDFWHGNPRFFNDTDIIVGELTVRQRHDYDKLVSEKLTGIGYVVIRFWEYEIETNLIKCLETILSKLGEKTIVEH